MPNSACEGPQFWSPPETVVWDVTQLTTPSSIPSSRPAVHSASSFSPGPVCADIRCSLSLVSSVTVIGGTALSSPEQAWPSSGGGFSNYFVRPAYQDTIISTFLTELGSTNAGRFNATSRAYPDIAAKADNFLIWADGISAINGTSASTPTVASVVALLNDRLLAQGRPQLGFLNPWLYANGSQAFTDIVDGKSAVACQNLADRGFDAVEGWDPVRPWVVVRSFHALLTEGMYRSLDSARLGSINGPLRSIYEMIHEGHLAPDTSF